MWPAEPKLPAVRGFVLAWDFVCTLCWDRSSRWGQLWSVPLLEMTWQILATASTSWWKPTCPGPTAELSLLELQRLLKKRWFPDGVPALVMPAPCSTHYHCLVRTKLLSVTDLGKNVLKQPGSHWCAHTVPITSFPKGWPSPNDPPLGQAVNQCSCRRQRPLSVLPAPRSQTVKWWKDQFSSDLIAFLLLGHPLI